MGFNFGYKSFESPFQIHGPFTNLFHDGCIITSICGLNYKAGKFLRTCTTLCRSLKSKYCSKYTNPRNSSYLYKVI